MILVRQHLGLQPEPGITAGAQHCCKGMVIGDHVDILLVTPVADPLRFDLAREDKAAALEAAGAPTAPLQALVGKVKSGDPENIEGQGARRYWGLLFGPEFRRDQDGDGVNALLNYGYTILRSATARAVVAAGLHPSIGLHHSNDANAMRLVDDLMEPFRPMADLKVWQLHQAAESHVTPDTKRALVRVLYDDMPTAAGVTPVMVCMQRLATSLAQVYLAEAQIVGVRL